MAHGTEIGNIIAEIKRLLENNLEVTIVLINPDDDVIIYCSRFLGLNVNEIKNRIRVTIRKFYELYENSSKEAKKKIILKLHNIPLSASALLIDSNLTNGKTLIDFKLYGFCRDDGFGIEFNKKGFSLYDKFTKSYLTIASGAKIIDFKKNIFRKY